MMASRPRNILRYFRLQIRDSRSRAVSRRLLSTPSPSQPPKPPNVNAIDSRSRLRRFNDRLPGFLRNYTTPLFGAPVTHITSFLILHEITAILPLFGLVGAFHYGAWMPDLSSETGETNAFDEGAARFGRWLKKKGWVDQDDVNTVAEHEATGEKITERAGVRLVLEFATAYAITKALLPARLAASVWATPWFARTVFTPTTNLARRLFRRG
ncbi:hypothetical protein N7499_001583 [Penicillium canescens]|uniref:Uncharacterized protein n=1 Tax=Penicillium canescens TaxID=5083 RepID=A0AAD6I5Y9_PENCN|nr:uncharacterized protein N7446_009126 [Penicillium canescens]KAJ5981409.1 hypothetical protein N7522_013830 [Penicillium canescens]KAJ6034377.1 hypothetical protein N7460_008552 [Penicillium canescens]KAJ6046038.1 hypothetical protein N7444_007292 [Penicillium canescens]KAJ6053114.1 hypothetical protein N7446_009126 [Penicillium canescens]KAJ6097209.1 hypothetical protein N7499_001583 [Penicillium canescens]